MPDHYINGKSKDAERKNAERTEDGLTTREEAALLRRAIRERWPIKPEYREGIANRMVAIAIDSKSGARASISAARVLVAADKLNLDEELKATPDQIEVTHSGTVDIRGAIGELLGNQDYVEFQRQRALARDTDPRAICQLRESGYPSVVANGKAHGDPRPGTNGHRNGSQ
jgi:hypothetical protein